mmetsp:Transcript_38574/g.95795  ORF Transcript_38574/g.95795 Transcript_38574/m.95795 type:complete len:240 (-) Transcript_38574:493-1212(-)
MWVRRVDSGLARAAAATCLYDRQIPRACAATTSAAATSDTGWRPVVSPRECAKARIDLASLTRGARLAARDKSLSLSKVGTTKRVGVVEIPTPCNLPPPSRPGCAPAAAAPRDASPSEPPPRISHPESPPPPPLPDNPMPTPSLSPPPPPPAPPFAALPDCWAPARSSGMAPAALATYAPGSSGGTRRPYMRLSLLYTLPRAKRSSWHVSATSRISRGSEFWRQMVYIHAPTSSMVQSP